MIALLTNPPAPLAVRVDLLGFRKPKRRPTFPELIWKLHQIIANPASRAQDVKTAKRALLRAIGQTREFQQMPGPAVVPRFRRVSTQKSATRLIEDNNMASCARAKLQEVP
jgi:hypothetical protein